MMGFEGCSLQNYGMLYTVLFLILKYLRRKPSFYQQLKETEAPPVEKKKSLIPYLYDSWRLNFKNSPTIAIHHM